MRPSDVFKKGILVSTLVSSLSGCVRQPCDPVKLAQTPSETSIPSQYKADVAFVKEVRKFGIEHLGLYECSPHYTWFDNSSKSEHTLYILTITQPAVLPTSRNAKHEFLPYFSIYREDVSDFLYLDSEKDDLTDEGEYYQEKGYDVYRRFTTNYGRSVSGKESPITAAFLSRSRVSQAQAVLHETCHATVEHSISSHFSSELDDSFCSLVGYAGAVEYFQARALQKMGSPEEVRAAADLVDAETSLAAHLNFSKYIISVYNQLQILYKSDVPHQKKMEERQKIFEEAKPFVGEEVNNAVLWDRYPYVAYFPLLVQLYEKQGKSVRTVVEKMKNCPENDAVDCLRKLL